MIFATFHQGKVDLDFNSDKKKNLIKCSIEGYIFGGIILHSSNSEIHTIKNYFEEEIIQFQASGKQTEIEIL